MGLSDGGTKQCHGTQSSSRVLLLYHRFYAGRGSIFPAVEDLANCVYIRPEGGSLMLEHFEWEGAAWNSKEVPKDFEFREIEPD